MPQVKRNDPCPCGSGKKYKNCCMRQDRLSASRELGAGGLQGHLLNMLSQYAQSPRFATDLVDAFAVFWGGLYDLNAVGDLDPDDMRRFFEWFIHDYHTRTGQQRVIEVFLEREGSRLTREAREQVDAWSTSVMSLHRFLGLAGDNVLELYDPLRQEAIEVEDKALARNARSGDLLIGRLYVYQGIWRLSMMTSLLPGEYEPGLVEYVSNAFGIYRDEHPGAEWDTFLRETGHIFNAYLISARAESLRSLIGPGTRYQDPAVTRDKLRAVTREAEQEAKAQAAPGQSQPREPRRPQMRRTASGLILPGAEAKPERPSVAGSDASDDAPAPRILIPGRDA